MSCLCLSLLLVAAFLQTSASLTAEVSMKCNRTVEIAAGEDVTLNCTIKMQFDCTRESYSWNNTLGKIPCNNIGLMEYTCDWDNLTYASLTVRNVMKDENYTVLVVTDCGLAKSHIKLQVKQNSSSTRGKMGPTRHTEQTTNHHMTAVILPVILTIFVALGLLYFLFGASKGREVTGCFKKITQEESNARGKNPLIV